MANTKFSITSEQYLEIDRQMQEIKLQLDRKGGSSLDPRLVSKKLRALIESSRSPKVDPNALPEGHYRVRVEYAPVAPIDELKKIFGRCRVTKILDGRRFRLQESCRGVKFRPGEKIFFLFQAEDSFCGKPDDREHYFHARSPMIDGARFRSRVAPKGYRAATHIETIEFAMAHPELSGYVGLGSYTRHEDDWNAVIHVTSRKRRIRLNHVSIDAAINTRILVLFIAI